jgi:hypothetical protein
VDNQWIVRWPSFCPKNFFHGARIESIRAQTVNGFGWKNNELSFPQITGNIGKDGIAWLLYRNEFGHYRSRAEKNLTASLFACWQKAWGKTVYFAKNE